MHLFFAVCPHAQIVVTEPPVNTGDLVGKDIQINCSAALASNQGFIWFYNGIGSTLDERIVQIDTSVSIYLSK